MDATVINEHVVHFEIGLFALLWLLEFNEGILQALFGLPIANDFTAYYVTEARENDFEIFRGRDGVQFAHEQHIIWWLDVCIWQVIDHR